MLCASSYTIESDLSLSSNKFYMSNTPNNFNTVFQSPAIAKSREKKCAISEFNVKAPEQYLIDLIPLNGRCLTKRP